MSIKTFLLCVTIVAMGMWLCGPCRAADQGDLFAGSFINSNANAIEGRFGVALDEKWQAGIFSTYYTKSAASQYDWGIGGFGKMIVNPEASLPLKGWFPEIGTWLDLPETIPAETYLIGKGEILPIGDGYIDLALHLGAGASAGPFCIECTYGIFEGGDWANQIQSGLEVNFGLCWAF
jgi:hypothetical protein